jgi:hypothetical protein
MYIGREGGGDGHQTRFFFPRIENFCFIFWVKNIKNIRDAGEVVMQSLKIIIIIIITR